jgi:hypothetical protein
MGKRKAEVITPPRNTRAKVGQADQDKGKGKMPEGESSQKPAKCSFACKAIRVALLQDPARMHRLRRNMKKMGSEGLLDVAWHHEEPAWLQEIWGKDWSAFPNTIRADPTL